MLMMVESTGCLVYTLVVDLVLLAEQVTISGGLVTVSSVCDINKKKCIHHPPGVRKSCLCIVRRPATWRAFTRDQFTTTRIYANSILELRLMARLSYDDCTMYIQSLAIACHLFASTLIAARFLNMFKNLFSDARSLAITCDHPGNRTWSQVVAMASVTRPLFDRIHTY